MFLIERDNGSTTEYWMSSPELQVVWAEDKDEWGCITNVYTVSKIKVSKNIWEATGRIFPMKDIAGKFLSGEQNVTLNATGLHMMRTDRPPNYTKWS